MGIEVANESGVEIDELRLVGVSRQVLDAMGIHPLVELAVLLVDEAEMSLLHESWMGEAGPTDVLSFPMDELRPGRADSEPDPDDQPSMLGDVVLCPTVAQRQAVVAGHDTQTELELLCTHGILHLLGFDHAEPDEEREMFGLQRQLLEAWQLSRQAGVVDSGPADSTFGSSTP
jgi:probable rRNA maturation factor